MERDTWYGEDEVTKNRRNKTFGYMQWPLLIDLDIL